MTTTNLTAGLGTGTYHLDPHRSICRLTVTHTLGLKPVTATMALIGGTITIAEPLERSIASAELDVATFTTDDPRRDRDIRGHRFLDAVAHPEIGFRSTGLRLTPEGWRLAGVLAVRGGSCEVTLDLVTARLEGDGCRFVATCTVDRFAAGITAGRLLIARLAHIELDLHAIPAHVRPKPAW